MGVRFGDIDFARVYAEQNVASFLGDPQKGPIPIRQFHGNPFVLSGYAIFFDSSITSSQISKNAASPCSSGS